jgi:tRNA pseudouridine55 synthase
MVKKNSGTGAGSGGIVLFAKRPGFTSFSSLYTIKHALGTSKAGHTGTLDSFASGLLVVCTGSLTRLASRITEFDKSYDAVIEFGRETDTLEWTGNTVRTASFPEKEPVIAAVAAFTGKLMQKPPLFSALHVNGERASSIARSGRQADLPSRPVSVFSADIEEYMFTSDGKVKAVRVKFVVSKGTYIRSLARDIGESCGSAAHLAGLRRLSVGSFKLEDAAGAALLPPFTIRSVYESVASQIPLKNADAGEKKQRIKFVPDETETALQNEVREKLCPMTELLASECGFGFAYLKPECKQAFINGKTLKEDMFDVPDSEKRNYHELAVFLSAEKEFLGMVACQPDGRYAYLFVVYARKS